jgi:hypothetical protein
MSHNYHNYHRPGSFYNSYLIRSDDVCPYCNLYNKIKPSLVLYEDDKVITLYSCLHCTKKYIFVKPDIKLIMNRLIDNSINNIQ